MQQITSDIALCLRKVTKHFYPGTAAEIVALDNVSLNIYSGEWLYIVGGNGCGKSTLLRTIDGELAPDSGSINTSNSQHIKTFFVESGSHYILVPSMTIYENLMLANPEGRMLPSLRFYRDKTHRLLFSSTLEPFNLGLEKRLDEQIAGMSSGQQQAVVAAKVLLSGAKVILLDEFTSALDKKTAPAILKILKEYALSNKITIIAVTHDYHWLQDTADRVVLMESGRIREILSMRTSSMDDLACAQTVENKDYIETETLVPALNADIIMEHLYGKK